MNPPQPITSASSSPMPPSPHMGCAGQQTVEIWKPDSIFLDLPHLEIAQALRAQDDQALWDGLRRSSDPEVFLDWLSTMAGGYVRTTPRREGSRRETYWKYSLIASPAILEAHTAPGIPARDEPTHGTDALQPELARWAGPHARAALVRQVITYESICRWSPCYQHYLVRNLAGEACVPIHSPPPEVALRLPAGLPTLGFVVASVGQWMEWPELPAADSLSSHDFAQRIAASATYVTGRQVAAGSVQAPQIFQQAVFQGVCDWLATLAASGQFNRWQVDPALPDVVNLRLFHEHDETLQAVIPLRLHQLGPYAMELITRQLWTDLGPCRHMDSTQEVQDFPPAHE